jgi:hypothetical protein
MRPFASSASSRPTARRSNDLSACSPPVEVQSTVHQSPSNGSTHWRTLSAKCGNTPRSALHCLAGRDEHGESTRTEQPGSSNANVESAMSKRHEGLDLEVALPDRCKARRRNRLPRRLPGPSYPVGAVYFLPAVAGTRTPWGDAYHWFPFACDAPVPASALRGFQTVFSGLIGARAA